jgi:DNA-binding MarR family transcriptional regulator
MGQSEVIEFLKQKKEPLSAGEIAKAMCENPSKIGAILSRLLKHDEVLFIEIDRLQSMKRCGCKKRIRLYYL